MIEAAVRIGKSQHGDYYVMCGGKICGGPHKTQQQAETDKAEIESGPPRELAKVEIDHGLHKGAVGWWIMFDGEAVIPCGSMEQAQKHAAAIEFGEIPMASFLRQSIGLGDAIALSGAAVVLAKRTGGITLPVRPENMASVRSIFVDHPTITFGDVDKFLRNMVPDNLLVEMSHVWLRETWMDQYQRIYKRFGIEYRHRWDSSPVQAACAKVEQLPVPEGDYLFLHEDASRNQLLDRAKVSSGLAVYEPTYVRGQSILAYADIVENAVELHVMDSCFFHLSEQLNPRGKLFIHRYPRPYGKLANRYLTRHEWVDVF